MFVCLSVLTLVRVRFLNLRIVSTVCCVVLNHCCGFNTVLKCARVLFLSAFFSGGSDNLVNLWRIASCSSAPWLGAEDNSNDPPDVKVSFFFVSLCVSAFHSQNTLECQRESGANSQSIRVVSQTRLLSIAVPASFSASLCLLF